MEIYASRRRGGGCDKPKNTHTHTTKLDAHALLGSLVRSLTQRAPPFVVGTREGAGIGGAVGAVAEKDAIAAGALGLVASRPASERVDRRVFAHPHARSVSKKLSLAASSLPPPPPSEMGWRWWWKRDRGGKNSSAYVALPCAVHLRVCLIFLPLEVRVLPCSCGGLGWGDCRDRPSLIGTSALPPPAAAAGAASF